MSTLIQDRQLAEVFVERDQYLSTRGCRRQDLFIPGIRGPVADPLDVVTRRAQDRHGAAPHTCVEQNLHEIEDSTSAGSMRSCPTRRRHDLRRVAGGQHAKDMLDGKPAVPDDRLAAEDGRVRRDSTEEFRFAASARHDSPSDHATSVPIPPGDGRFQRPSCPGKEPYRDSARACRCDSVSEDTCSASIILTGTGPCRAVNDCLNGDQESPQ